MACPWLIGEAEAALLWAASRFDEKRGARFSTYAIPFALGALRELCRRNAPMNIPREELRLLTAAERRREEWQQENGREPTVEELAQRMGQPPEKLAAMLSARERMNACWPPPRTMQKPSKTRSFGGTRCAVWDGPMGRCCGCVSLAD